VALPIFAVTLFVSAFILFLVQPIVGKMILPKLGGTPQVWNTCMVFFQAALLAGDLGTAETTWHTQWEDSREAKAWDRWLVGGRLAATRAEMAMAMGRLDEAIQLLQRNDAKNLQALLNAAKRNRDKLIG